MRRRTFLQIAGGSTLAAALPESDRATEPAPRATIRPAIYTGIDNSTPIVDLVPLIRQAGFDVLALSNPKHNGYDTPAGRAVIRGLLDQHGMTLDSIHAPFPEGDRLFDLDEAKRQESIRQCKIAVEAAAELDGPIVVVHLIQPYDIPHGDSRDRMLTLGKESLRKLVDHAAERKVKLALENGQRRDYDEVLEDCLAEFPAATVGFCYDSGHENVQGTCFRMLEKNADRLLTLHIHDNRGTDTHELPYEGTIPWDTFRPLFHRLDYRGNLPLEVVSKGSPIRDLKAFLAEAYKRTQRLLEPLRSPPAVAE